MARKPRVHYEDAIYHVIARGNNRERVFEAGDAKSKYLEILADYKERYGFRLYAYVMMDSHVHILLQINKTPLAKIMQGIQQRFTQYYNRQYNRSGHVFEQRYKAYLCEEESYLMTLISYIHQNPLRAEMSEGIDYRWSSHQAYLRGNSGLIDCDFLLDAMGSTRDQAITQYQQLMGVIAQKPECIIERPVEKEVAKSNEETKIENEPAESTWEQLVDRIATEEQVDRAQLLGKCRIHQVVAARRRLICEAIEGKIMTRAQLARVLKIDAANITRVCQNVDCR